jgi:CrcB protein
LSSTANILLVGLGGFAGAVGRYLLGGWVLHHSLNAKFPWSTFAVNVLGCLLIGLLSGLAERLDWFTPSMRLLLLTGLLGGFTTFSAFSLEATFLWERSPMLAAVYVALSVGLGLVACLAGFWLFRR